MLVSNVVFTAQDAVPYRLPRSLKAKICIMFFVYSISDIDTDYNSFNILYIFFTVYLILSEFK